PRAEMRRPRAVRTEAATRWLLAGVRHRPRRACRGAVLAAEGNAVGPMHDTKFSPGFRLSAVDVLMLVGGIAATVALAAITWWWGFVVGFVLAHFFLFCNVIRMARPLELSWAFM